MSAAALLALVVALAAHLAAQPAPRRLAVAIAAVENSLDFDDEDADDVAQRGDAG
ncbi:MAG: hypothetical protein ACREO3_01365 [Arenimonas sp.]